MATAGALLVGAIYFLLGLLGFFFLGDVQGSLANHDTNDTMLGLELNALQNVVHLVLGILGMAAATRSSTARSYGARWPSSVAPFSSTGPSPWATGTSTC